MLIPAGVASRACAISSCQWAKGVHPGLRKISVQHHLKEQSWLVRDTAFQDKVMYQNEGDVYSKSKINFFLGATDFYQIKTFFHTG